MTNLLHNITAMDAKTISIFNATIMQGKKGVVKTINLSEKLTDLSGKTFHQTIIQKCFFSLTTYSDKKLENSLPIFLISILEERGSMVTSSSLLSLLPSFRTPEIPSCLSRHGFGLSRYHRFLVSTLGSHCPVICML